MMWIFWGSVAIAIGLYLFFRRGLSAAPDNAPAGKPNLVRTLLAGLGRSAIGLGFIALGVLMLANTSFVYVAADQVGHLKRVYAFQELPPGHVVALPGQKGP